MAGPRRGGPRTPLWPGVPDNLDLKVWDPRTSLWLHSIHNTTSCCPTPSKVPSLELYESIAAAAVMNPAFKETTRRAHEGAPCWIDGLNFCVELPGGGSATLTSLFAAEISCSPLNVVDCKGLQLLALVPPLDDRGLRATSATGDDRTGAPVWYVVFDSNHIERVQFQQELCRLGCGRTDLHRVYKVLPGEKSLFGKGANASVKRMFDAEGRMAAVKLMNAPTDLDAVQREVATLLTVQTHANVMDFLAMSWTREESPRFYLVFSAATGGDMFNRVMNQGMLPEAKAKQLLAGAMKGLQHIHGKFVVHRDIKAENILISSKGAEERAILADFGLATFISDEVQMARRCGTPGYVAPEVCLGHPYDVNIDVFGMGVILYFMLSRGMPFKVKDRDVTATMRKTVECRLHLRKPPWDAHSSRLRSMLRATICKNPEERLSATEALSHPWMHTSSSSGVTRRSEAKAELKLGLPRRQLSVQGTADDGGGLQHPVMPGAYYPIPLVHPKVMYAKLESPQVAA